MLLRSLAPDTRVVWPSFCCTKYSVALRDREGHHCPERVNGKCRLSQVKSKINISVSFLTKISDMYPFQSMPICMDQDIFTRSTYKKCSFNCTRCTIHNTTLLPELDNSCTKHKSLAQGNFWVQKKGICCCSILSS